MAEQSQIQFFWTQIKEKAEEIIAPVSFNAFIKDLEPVDVLNRRIVLKAPTEIYANAVVKKHAEKLRDAIRKANVGINDFKLVVDGSDVFCFEDEDLVDDVKSVPVNKN